MALSYLEGNVVSETAARDSHLEWLRCPNRLDRECPGDVDLHLIADNNATNKPAEVWGRLAKDRRCQLHSTVTYSSWMNMVERCFRDLTVDVLLDGSFGSVTKMGYAINDYLEERSLNPTPYESRAVGAEVLAYTMRAREKAATLVQWTHRLAHWGRRMCVTASNYCEPHE